MKKLVKLILFFMISYPLAGIVISSCAEESDCSMSGRELLNGDMRILNNDGIVENDTLDSLTITAFKTDSTILNNQKNVTRISLPLRFSSDTTILVLHYSRSTRDTITIRHTNTPKFVSMDCGYEMKQAILDIKHTIHRLDSIHITSKNANTNGTRNFELFHKNN